MKKPADKNSGNGENGAAMVEFALVFPVQLLVFLLGLQLCLIIVGKQVVNYAAFCAARAEAVDEDSEKAAKFACTPIGGVATAGGAFDALYLPGWDGKGPDLDVLSQRAAEKTTVIVDETYTDNLHRTANGRLVVRVRYSFEMMIPLANWVIFYGLDAISPGLVHFKSIDTLGNVPPDSIGLVIGGVPHLILEEKGVVPAYNEVRSEAETPHDLVEDPNHQRYP